MNTRAILIGSALALTLAGPALAGPRDDVLAAMSRCSAVTDGAARLACYDALKPQLEAALAAPAPPTQVAASGDSSSWFGLDHLFGGGETPQTQPKAFGSERLPDAQKAAVNPPPPETAAAHEIDSINAKITDYALTPAGRFIVFLDNDQVWQQVDGDTAKARFLKPASANTVTISRAIFGSYALKLNDLNGLFKVKRVK